MTLKELGSCVHVRRGDRVVEFRKDGQIYHALCPKGGGYMRWDNWANLSEPLRAKCPGCGLYLPSTDLNLLPAEVSTSRHGSCSEGTQAGKPGTENDKIIPSEGA